MFLIPLIIVFLLYSSGNVVHGSGSSKAEDDSTFCHPALGTAKPPCPPCAKSTWTYLTSENDDLNPNAIPVETKDIPKWFGCTQREDTTNSFSVFGASENDLAKSFTDKNKPDEEYPVDVNLIFQPTSPCEVQVVRCPPEKVIECKDKLMLAHEDEYRRQCKETFVKNFEYEIEKGKFDEDLAAYWLEYDPDFVRLDDKGNLKVTYDYTTFGCPIEPYQEQDDGFAPDLRILTQDMNRNTTLGLKYNNSYILIEIFGTKDFLSDKGYFWDPENNKKLCIGKPQRLFEMIDIWMGEPFIPKTKARDPLSIWKTYKSCNDTPPVKKSWKAGTYEIMNNNKYDKRNKTNSLVWSTENKRPETLIFLAIAVDDPDCPYYTLFGVSLPKPTELDTLWSLWWFIFFTLLWLLLVVVGYYWRKAQIRRQYFEEARSERLKQSAWAVIYRYEKLLHESENRQIEKEMMPDNKGDGPASGTNSKKSKV